MTTEAAGAAPQDWKAIAAAFREPFRPEAIKQRAGKGGMRFDYIDARDVQNRLDEVVGVGGWSDEYEVIDPERMGIKCRLTVLGVSKEGIGYPNNPIGATNQKGERVDSDEPGKDSESDGLKRAAVKFGIGRHLYEGKPTARSQQIRPEPPRAVSPPRSTEPSPNAEGVDARVRELIDELSTLERKTVPVIVNALKHSCGLGQHDLITDADPEAKRKMIAGLEARIAKAKTTEIQPARTV